MSYDEPEYDLLAAFKARFGLNDAASHTESDVPPDTKVLSSAKHIYDNAIDVSISMEGTKAAARSVHDLMQARNYSTLAWSEHPMHPDPSQMGEEETVNFIFTTDLLNFSFWTSDDAPANGERFAIDYAGARWHGYMGFVASLRRALDAGIPITTPDFWQCEDDCTDELLADIFRPAPGAAALPMLPERARLLRAAGTTLYEHYSCSPLTLVRRARGSARRFVHELTGLGKPFAPLWCDTAEFDDERVHFHKRAQIFAADLWACFDGAPASPGEFDDIDALTTFPDYRVPQVLCALGVLQYSPPLESRIVRGDEIENGNAREVEIRGCTVWAVELLRREIVALQQNDNGDTETDLPNGHTNGVMVASESEVNEMLPKKGKKSSPVNAVLLDFFLYDLCQEKEASGKLAGALQHHRTRSIWY